MSGQKSKPVYKTEDLVSLSNNLILYNDDVNTFDLVIESLIEVCDHDFEQAEQCALIAHYKGRCVVKSGAFEELKGMSEELTLRKLTVSVE